MSVRRRAAWPRPKGPVALAPKAWGEDSEVLERAPGEKAYAEVGEYAVVDVCGPLEQHASWLFDSYDAIRTRVAAALESGAKAIWLRINSPGGDFAGSLELGRELRAKARAAKKPLKAFTDSQALSAAFGLAVACDEIVITPSASVGSVGVWAPLLSTVDQDKLMGAQVVIVASGARKADRNPHVPITEGAVDALQAQVDAMAGMFFEHVAEMRGLRPSAVKAVEGADLLGTRAVAAGFADRIVDSWESLLAGASAEQGKAMSKYDEALGAMRRAAEGEDEDAKKAKKALKAWEDDEKKAKGEGEEEKKHEEEAKAKAEEDEKKKKDEEEAKAKASAEPGLEAIRQIHDLRSELNAKAEADERKNLLASRPDFDEQVRGFLAKSSIEQVREAVKTFPRAARRSSPAAASQAMPTVVGAEQGDMSLDLGGDEDRAIAKAMGNPEPVKFEIGCGDLAAARRYLKSRATTPANGG